MVLVSPIAADAFSETQLSADVLLTNHASYLLNLLNSISSHYDLSKGDQANRVDNASRTSTSRLRAQPRMFFVQLTAMISTSPEPCVQFLCQQFSFRRFYRELLDNDQTILTYQLDRMRQRAAHLLLTFDCGPRTSSEGHATGTPDRALDRT